MTALQRLEASPADLFFRRHYVSCRLAMVALRLSRVWYRVRWPAYCRVCNGTGGEAYGGGFDEPPGFEQCDALPWEFCHRCGHDGLTVDGEGPCTHCGWNFGEDDGDALPMLELGLCWGACEERRDARIDYR